MQTADQAAMQAAAEFSLGVLAVAEDMQLPIETAMTGVSILLFGLATQYLTDKGLPMTPANVAGFIIQHAEYTVELSAKLAAASQSQEGENPL